MKDMIVGECVCPHCHELTRVTEDESRVLEVQCEHCEELFAISD